MNIKDYESNNSNFDMLNEMYKELSDNKGVAELIVETYKNQMNIIIKKKIIKNIDKKYIGF